MIILLGKDSTRREDKDGRKGDTGDRRSTNYHADNMNSKYTEVENLTCSICGEDGHVATMGPNHLKVIQYFACKRFVDMNPAERFATLKDKGLCWQCLFPGAIAKKGKHADGKCQRDFVCKYQIHIKFKRKKHVLLCDEHKETEENRKLLEEYKSRYILREKTINITCQPFQRKSSWHFIQSVVMIQIKKIQIKKSFFWRSNQKILEKRLSISFKSLKLMDKNIPSSMIMDVGILFPDTRQSEELVKEHGKKEKVLFKLEELVVVSQNHCMEFTQ